MMAAVLPGMKRRMRQWAMAVFNRPWCILCMAG
jgi:hypothetical protein